MIQFQNRKSLSQLNLRPLFSFLVFFVSLSIFSNESSFAQYQKTQKAVYKKMGSYVPAYYESLPVDYAANPSKKYPLLIFIHGKGELGDGSSGKLPLVLRNGPPKLLNQGVFPASFTVGGQSHSFIVISPQINTYDYSLSTTFVTQILNYCLANYRVDEQRVYITGLSMGGMIGWRFIGDNKSNADKIAASVLVCSGASNTNSRITNIATSKLPVWLTNNSGDPVISASGATSAVKALNEFIPTPPKSWLTIFNASGHDAWTKTYDPNFKQEGLNVYEWMLSYKRGGTSQTTPPTANAGTSQTITLPTNSVTLDGSKSTAGTGSITSYSWSKISGPAATITSPTAVKTTVTGLVAGSYQFNLTVKNSGGSSASATVTVTVNEADVPLNSNAGGNQTITLPTSSVTVDGSNSTYPSGSTFLWSKREGPAGGTISNPTSLKTTITGLTNAGDYRFSLKITDKNGNISSSSMHVIVNPAPENPGNTPLVADAGSNQTITLPASSVTLDGSGSTGPGELTHVWKQTSGPKSATIASIYSIKTAVSGLTTAGTYIFQLELKDAGGNTDVASVSVIVNESAASLLHSDAGSDQTITLPVSSVTIDGTGSSGPVGLTHLWKQTGGPKTATIGSIYSIKTTVSGLTVAGTYSFQLELKDTDGNVDVSTVNIIVNSSSTGALKPNAGPNQTITLPESSVTLDGSGSSGPVGLTHVWKQSGGPKTATIDYIYSIKTTVSGLTVAGTYSFQLELKDPDGNIATSTVQIIVNSGPAGSTEGGGSSEPFEANAGGNQTIKQPASSATLDGSKSTWSSASGATHYWRQTDGPVTANILNPYSIKTEVTGLTQTGDYKFQIVFTDDNGNRSASSTHVFVTSAASARLAAPVNGMSAESVAAQNPGELNLNTVENLSVAINPNPVQSNMNLQISGKPEGKASVIVYNLTGQVLLQQEFVKSGSGTTNKTFNVSKLAAGTYITQVVVGNQYKKAVKLLKQ